MKHIFKKHTLLIAISLSTIVALSIAGYYFYQYQQAQKFLKNPIISNQLELEDLLSKVGKLMYLPSNEQPTIATVSDYKKLQSQIFFKNAKNGFKVLIYPKAQLAVLYDPYSNKIVTTGPVTTSQKALAAQNVNVAIHNGTPVLGLTNIIEQELKNKLANVDIVQKGNANYYYDKTVVVDLTKKDPKTTTQIATFLGAQVATTPPKNETIPPTADILIILGKNN